MHRRPAGNLAHDFVLPTLLFVALGAMAWAVRGCSGFGAMNGCAFAGLAWGTGWWFISRHSPPGHARPFSSGWVILALLVGIGISGNRGWMQWPSFFLGQLQTNYSKGEFVPIPRIYGFVWLFIAGVPWAGIGACMLAWCNSLREPGLATTLPPLGGERMGTRWNASLPMREFAKTWGPRIVCGLGLAFVARACFYAFPEIFLPFYKAMSAQYADAHANPNLRRLFGDNREAITHLGLYLGFVLAEALRRNWRNVTLILTVGLVNGLGWAACQNWKWAASLWPNSNFNWWRCWESCGGISIGLAYGIAYYLANQPVPDAEIEAHSPVLERFGAYLGLLLGLGLAVKNGLKGWFNIYVGKENHWNIVLWRVIGPLMILGLVLIIVRLRRRPPAPASDAFPHDYRLVWLVLLTQNAIAQLITGPHSNWNETAFSIYYLLLFSISGVIVHHYHCLGGEDPSAALPGSASRFAASAASQTEIPSGMA